MSRKTRNATVEFKVYVNARTQKDCEKIRVERSVSRKLPPGGLPILWPQQRFTFPKESCEVAHLTAQRREGFHDGGNR
jgi:hypothetical protein